MYSALIIDDEKPGRIVINKLAKWRYYSIDHIEEAEDGKQGIAFIRERRPDIVFVDMQMPVMNGMEFLAAASREFPECAYIVISGYDDFDYLQNAIRCGACDYLLKPIVADDLNNAIEKAIKKLNPNVVFGDLEPNSDIKAEEVIDIIKEQIEKNYSSNISITAFADKYYFSKEYLSKLFKLKYSYGIYEYLLKIRMERAKELIYGTNMKIRDIAIRTGYKDTNYFSKAFRKYWHITPSQCRKNQ